MNASERGRINYTTGQDTDTYTVRLTSARTYVKGQWGIHPCRHLGGFPNRIIVRLLEGNTVASNNNDGQGLNSKLTYAPTHTGDYNLKVLSLVTGEGGTYKVKVKQT